MTNPRDTDGRDKSWRDEWWGTTWADKVAVHQHSIVILSWVGVGCERALIIFWPIWQSISWKFMVSTRLLFYVRSINIPCYCCEYFLSGHRLGHEKGLAGQYWLRQRTSELEKNNVINQQVLIHTNCLTSSADQWTRWRDEQTLYVPVYWLVTGTNGCCCSDMAAMAACW